MLIIRSNKLMIADPTEELMTWCKRNLIIANPEYAKKARMNLWLGNTPKTICLYETVGETLLLPSGVLSLLPQDIVDKSIVIDDFTKPTAIDFKADVPLYDYQEEAVSAMVDAEYGILQSAAGSGKTQMGIALFSRIGKRALWLCHTKDLVNQSKERAEQYIDKSLIGVITDGKVQIGEGVTFATIQTMAKLHLSHYKNHWDCIIVDEVHRVSGSPTAITQYQKVLNSLAAKHKYGMSATVHRADGMIFATYSLVGNVAYRVPDEAVAEKIMQVSVLPVGLNTRMSREVLNTDGTINYARLINYLSDHSERNSVIADEIIKNADHPSLILSERLNQLEQLIELLPDELRKKSVMITGKMSGKRGKAEREQALEEMRAGKKQFLFATYQLAKEGLDIPRLERLFLATPVKDYAVVTQAIGRIARRNEGKVEPICYDFVDSIGYCVKAFKCRLRTYRKNGCLVQSMK